ncbi:hypothetical protein GDO81_024009 [Engystomops pustulosus]|uniref:UPAR/Ly6 domain-containing protein n=1 Tax=Engystomops pustulosus TaxID=76066 RepID=A0AAV6ZN42_ENGPU|nr:hypothetical protein GDO81_024009 [Engystomops pustulosus]
MILILSLISALVARSWALSCTQCSSTNTVSCTGSDVTCSSDKSCGSSFTDSNFGGTNIKSVIRTCVLTSECNFTGTVRLKEGHIQLATSCCHTDKCIPNEPKFPAVSTKVNGLVCRSCSSLSSNWCYTADTVQCTGNEDRCLLQATEIKGSVSTSFRGCATKSLCDLGSQTQTIEGVTTKVKFACTDGGISVHTAVLAPAVVCLLLLNFLF